MTGDDFNERFLEKGKELYEQGDKAELLYCLSYCIRNRALIPEWLRQAFNNAYHRAALRSVASWDDVFGKPLKKGTQLAPAQRNLLIGPFIASRVREQAEAGKPIDKGLFEAIGAEFDISGTTTSDIYYDLEKGMASVNDEAIINRTVKFGIFRKLK